MRYVMLCASGFMDDVVFSNYAMNRTESKTTCMLSPVRHVAALVGRQTTLFGRDCLMAAPEAKSAVSDCILLSVADSIKCRWQCCERIDPFVPLRENVTLFKKPEVHKLLHCRRRRTEPRPQVTCAENFVKFGRVVFEICERTDRETDIQTS